MKHTSYINPFETKDIEYWTRKWDITPSELYNAILETGSSNVNTLKKNLKGKGLWLFPMGKIIHDLVIKTKLG